MPRFAGSCHCGAVTVAFETACDPASLEVRSCACGFCRRHGGMTASDPAGRLDITAALGDALRYRFGLAITDFIVCAGCGCYVAAVMEEPDGTGFGVVNVRMLDEAALFTTPAAPRDYGTEDAAGRRARRRGMWTPLGTVALA